MKTDFLPSREADLVTWLNNFQAKITAAPTIYGLTAAMATSNGTLTTAFTTAYAVANADATRSPMNVTLKNTAKRAVIGNVRMLSRLVQGTASVTPAQKQDLGLNPRDVLPTPVPIPPFAPDIDIVSVIGRIVKVRIHDSQSESKRGKPAGCASAGVFSYSGSLAPTDPAAYKFEGITTRTVVDIEFPETVASGATVWLSACWYNPRGQSGVSCSPVSVTIQGGAARAAA